MKKLMILALLAVFAGGFASSSSEAAFLGRVRITGKVIRISEKDITLKSGKGQVRIPKSVADPKGNRNLRPGQEIVVAANLAEIVRYNKSLAKK
jgi:hypothetical protein